jgi:hypothetical protein
MDEREVNVDLRREGAARQGMKKTKADRRRGKDKRPDGEHAHHS